MIDDLEASIDYLIEAGPEAERGVSIRPGPAPRQGVYFEAGCAMGLARPVIWLCRDDDFANVHFDTRQYNHIVWTTPEHLRRSLNDRIQATIGKRG